MSVDAQPPAKRMRLAYHHRHKIQHGLQAGAFDGLAVLPDTSIDKLLFDSIRAICVEQAVKLAIEEPVIESVVLESIHNAAEEFMLRICAKVQQSMTAARRTVPIAPDFETAFNILSVPRPDDELLGYQTKPPINPQLLPTPPPEDPFHNHVELPASFLGPELGQQDELKRLTFDSSALPPLPSAHTYKDSAVLNERETDSRRIRELATEEGKLGEQALRKLAGAVKIDTALSMEPESRAVRSHHGPRRRQPALTEEAVFEETMRDLLKNESGKFELGPIVTSEKVYRMPDDARMKRKTAATSKGSSTQPQPAGSNAASRYNVLPPPKSRGAPAKGDRMDLG